MNDNKIIGGCFLFSFTLMLLFGVFYFPKEPFDNSTTWYTATVIINTNPQQTYYVKDIYPIKAYARWGHNNLSCNNISSTAPIIVTNKQTYIEHSHLCNLFWSRVWFIVLLIFACLFLTTVGIALSYK